MLSATRSTGLPVGLQNQGSLFLALSSCLLFEGLSGKESACEAGEETWVRSLGWEDPLEEEMTTHSSFLAWRIPWTEEPGGLVHSIEKSWT